MKVNWDGALDMQTQVIDMGGIVRDSEGEVIASICSNLSHYTLLVIAEALALRWVMILYEEMGLTQLSFEGDFLIVVKAACGLKVGNKVLGPINVYDIQNLLLSHPDWTVNYAPQKSNIAIHTLAKLACTLLT